MNSDNMICIRGIFEYFVGRGFWRSGFFVIRFGGIRGGWFGFIVRIIKFGIVYLVFGIGSCNVDNL